MTGYKRFALLYDLGQTIAFMMGYICVDVYLNKINWERCLILIPLIFVSFVATRFILYGLFMRTNKSKTITCPDCSSTNIATVNKDHKYKLYEKDTTALLPFRVCLACGLEYLDNEGQTKLEYDTFKQKWKIHSNYLDRIQQEKIISGDTYNRAKILSDILEKNNVSVPCAGCNDDLPERAALAMSWNNDEHHLDAELNTTCKEVEWFYRNRKTKEEYYIELPADTLNDKMLNYIKLIS